MAFPEGIEGRVISGPNLRIADPAPRVGNQVLENHCKDVTFAVMDPGNLTVATGMQSATFLAYAGGKVTVCRCQQPVLTGPMSGCYVFTFTRGGATHVAHVGTYLGPQDPLTQGAKQAWRTLVAQPGVSNVYGYNPIDFRQQSDTAIPPPGTPGATYNKAEIFTVVQPSGLVYLVVLAGDTSVAMSSPNRFVQRVVRLQLPRPWATVQNAPAWA